MTSSGALPTDGLSGTAAGVTVDGAKRQPRRDPWGTSVTLVAR